MSVRILNKKATEATVPRAQSSPDSGNQEVFVIENGSDGPGCHVTVSRELPSPKPCLVST